ncbi:MAG: ABC transporter substrate-binding protein [Phycisphaerales bacterium]
MKIQVIVISLLLALVLGVPFMMSAGKKGAGHEPGTRTLIVVTPHVPQIRDEFGYGFSRWHEREYGEPVSIDWRAPGGTSEIRKQLKALFEKRIKDGNYTLDEQGVLSFADGSAIPFDIMFGGGSYDHSKVKRGVTVATTQTTGSTTIDQEITVSMSRAMNFTQDELDTLFGNNAIGPQELYDPDQHWIGTALSSFGIVYNRDVFRQLGLEDPKAFDDLTVPELAGWIALADPRQSGSITTTFDSILGNEGWEHGWRTLRGMCGNTRYFTNSSTKPPIDVSQGEAAAGLAIDFYGRGQAQVVKDSGGGDRVGYADPAGAVYVDADPVSIINGGPDYELATRFVRYCMTDEAQALWQFKKDDPDNPLGPDGLPMGPQWHELRRMPVKRSMYADYLDYFVDKADPFELVSDVKNPGWRTGVQVMMGCFGIDIANDCRAAYNALNAAIASGNFSDAELAELDALFYAFPDTQIEGKMVPFTADTFHQVRNVWRDPKKKAQLEIEYTTFFRKNYREIVRRVKAKK